MLTNPPHHDAKSALYTPAERTAAALRSTWVSVGVNLALAGAQIVLGYLSTEQVTAVLDRQQYLQLPLEVRMQRAALPVSS